MELPENKLQYWKAKFIDGLPPLFAERVRKVLRGNQVDIPYAVLSYGKIIGVCTQEGLNLCNELKMARQLKMDKLKERSQLGDFCEQFIKAKNFSWNIYEIRGELFDIDLNLSLMDLGDTSIIGGFN